MSFSKINYKDNETIITADNLNDIQDAILEGYQPDGTIGYTAFAESTKLALLNLIYPIGSIYMSVNSISPANQFGGTWEQIKDRFILAAGSSYTAGATGGEATVKLTENTIPKHCHKGLYYTQPSNNGNNICLNDGTKGYKLTWAGQYHPTNGGGGGTDELWTNYAGGSQAHNNMPPYLVAYMWKRIA